MTTEPATPGHESAAAAPPLRQPRGGRSRDWVRIAAIWVVLSVAADVLWIKLVGPHVPPGAMSNMAIGAQFDFNVLIVMALPVLIGVWVYMAYAIVTWRASKGGPDPVAGTGSRGHGPIESTWIIVTSVMVLFLAGFGTYELIQPGGSGGGQGPTPLWTTA
jgi:cytochrome c oxidase subunit 2